MLFNKKIYTTRTTALFQHSIYYYGTSIQHAAMCFFLPRDYIFWFYPSSAGPTKTPRFIGEKWKGERKYYVILKCEIRARLARVVYLLRETCWSAAASVGLSRPPGHCLTRSTSARGVVIHTLRIILFL